MPGKTVQGLFGYFSFVLTQVSCSLLEDWRVWQLRCQGQGSDQGHPLAGGGASVEAKLGAKIAVTNAESHVQAENSMSDTMVLEKLLAGLPVAKELKAGGLNLKINTVEFEKNKDLLYGCIDLRAMNYSTTE